MFTIILCLSILIFILPKKVKKIFAVVNIVAASFTLLLMVFEFFPSVVYFLGNYNPVLWGANFLTELCYRLPLLPAVICNVAINVIICAFVIVITVIAKKVDVFGAIGKALSKAGTGLSKVFCKVGSAIKKFFVVLIPSAAKKTWGWIKKAAMFIWQKIKQFAIFVLPFLKKAYNVSKDKAIETVAAVKNKQEELKKEAEQKKANQSAYYENNVYQQQIYQPQPPVQEPVQSSQFDTQPEVSLKKESLELTELVCSKCGAKVDKDSKFCKTCGALITLGTSGQAPQQSFFQQSQVVETEVKEKPKNFFCTNCGAKLREGNKFCEQCGASVSGEPRPQNSQSQQTYNQSQYQYAQNQNMNYQYGAIQRHISNARYFLFSKTTVGSVVSYALLTPIGIALLFVIGAGCFTLAAKCGYWARYNRDFGILFKFLKVIIYIIGGILLILSAANTIVMPIELSRKIAAAVETPRVIFINDTLFYPGYFYTDKIVHINQINRTGFSSVNDIRVYTITVNSIYITVEDQDKIVAFDQALRARRAELGYPLP